MKNLSLKWPDKGFKDSIEPILLLVLLLCIWPVGQRLMLRQNPMAGAIDPGIWLLILLSVISFLLLTGLSLWLLQRFWLAMGLLPLGIMVLRFNSLEVWQQLGFWWASFSVLLLAAVGCLSAIC